MAGELFLGALTGAIVSAVVDELIVLIKGVYRCKEVCDDLVKTLESIKPLLTKVDESSDSKNVEVQDWLKGLRSLLLQAKGTAEDCVVKKSWLSFKYVKRWFLTSKIQGIHDKIVGKISSEGVLATLNGVQEIIRKLDGGILASAMIDQQLHFDMQQVPAHVAAFDNNPFKKLKELIVSMPSITSNTIGVKGKGGVGKTLLAKMVNNDKDVHMKYGVGSILWMTVGKDVSVPAAYKQMGKFLNNGGVFERDYIDKDLEAQRTYLMEAFKQMKVLVILDDIWGNTVVKNHAMTYWLDICKGDGSITLITTRDGAVLDCARVMERIEVKSLSKDESWKLFSYHAFQPNEPPPGEVKDIAMEICNECKGLPLALEVIGGALWGKITKSSWKYALSRLRRSESWLNSASMEDALFDRLKFSYDVLSVEAKKCFLYFAAFPEDYWIRFEELCSIWQAEGLFGPHDAEDSFDAEDKLNTGRMTLINLADRSLIDLDHDGEHAKVHDVMRDLAIRIIRNAKVGEWAYECQFEPGKVLETLPEIKDTTKRVSFVGTHVKNFDPQMFVKGDNLQTCLLSSITIDDEIELPTSLPENFFLYMTCLLYLNLRDFWFMSELPKSIKELESLTHLDLSGCKSLKELPEGIKELKSLTHLYVRNCSLKELPEGINELKSLTHLYINDCGSLKELPEGIKELKSLTHLDLSGCWSLKELPEGIKELKSLTHLNLSWCNSLKELPKGIQELKSLTHLDLRGCESLEELPEVIKELKSLTHLNLSWCKSLKELPEGIKELKSLTHLDLRGCRSLKELPEGIKELKSLMHLDLCWCESLKELPEGIKELKSLTHLDLSGCESLKELPEGIKELKSLMHLDLRWCKSLKELPEGIKELKSLTHLDLRGCSSLKELPEGIKELKSLVY